jgi:transposase
MAARIATRQGMPVSPATILRLVRRTRVAEKPIPTLLGVDEWAYRKRLDFKTILVDLSTNRPVELLPDAGATTLASWLQQHPGIEVIARDRAGSFAEGARQGAPDAVQVADRFHLMQNLRTAIEEVLKQMVEVRQLVAEVLAEQTTPLQPDAAPLVDSDSATISLPQPELRRARDPYRNRVQEQRRAQRLARYEQVCALHQAGALQQEIAERLTITRATVSRYLKATGFPERAPYPHLESKLDPYHSYLSQRWAAGETNGRQLWQEVQSLGFTGSLMAVMRWAARQQLLAPAPPSTRRGRKGQAKGDQGQQALAPLRTRRVAWWLLSRPDRLSAERQAVLARMEQANTPFGQLYRLTVQFTEMLRKRQPEQLRPWLDMAQASDLRELKSLAEGMERDYAAAEAALRLPYSTEYVAYCTSSLASTSCSTPTCSAPTARARVQRLKQTRATVIVPRSLDVSSTIPPPDGRLLHLQPSGQLLNRQHAGFPQPRVAVFQPMVPPQLRDVHDLKRQPSEGRISLVVQLLGNLGIG